MGVGNFKRPPFIWRIWCVKMISVRKTESAKSLPNEWNAKYFVWKQCIECASITIVNNNTITVACLFNEASLNSIVCYFEAHFGILFTSIWFLTPFHMCVCVCACKCVRIVFSSVEGTLHASFRLSCDEENHKMFVAMTTDCLFDLDT